MGRQELRGVGAVGALLVMACAASNGGELSAREFPSAFAGRVCKATQRCCEHQSYPFDLTGCERQLRDSAARELAEYDGLQVRFDAESAQLCLDDYANAACLERAPGSDDVKRHCNFMFQGLVEVGGACRRTDECRVEGAQSAQCLDGICVLDAEPTAGGALGAACGSTCKDVSGSRACLPPFVGFGDPVSDATLPVCFTSDGRHCAGRAGARTCQPLIVQGESCLGSSQGCAAGTFCELATRVCQPQTESGACDAISDACAPTSACDLEAGRCVPVSGPLGGPCHAAADCQTGYCNPFSVCQWPASAESCSNPRLR